MINLKIFHNIKITIDPLHVNSTFKEEKPLIFQGNFSEENGIAVCFEAHFNARLKRR